MRGLILAALCCIGVAACGSNPGVNAGAPAPTTGANVGAWLKSNVIDPTATLIQDPNTQLVVKTIGAGTKTAICRASALSLLAQAVANNPQVRADDGTKQGISEAYVYSSAACEAFGGSVVGTATSTAPMPVLAAPSS